MVKGYHKCSIPIGVDDKEKRGERDPALKVTDNSSGCQLGLYSVNWCLCVGYWRSKLKSKFLMPATVVFSGNTVNTGSALKALSALTVNFLITLTINILVNWNVFVFIPAWEGNPANQNQTTLNTLILIVWLVRLSLIIKFSSLINWTHREVPIQLFSITEPIKLQSDRLGSISYARCTYKAFWFTKWDHKIILFDRFLFQKDTLFKTQNCENHNLFRSPIKAKIIRDCCSPSLKARNKLETKSTRIFLESPLIMTEKVICGQNLTFKRSWFHWKCHITLGLPAPLKSLPYPGA